MRIFKGLASICVDHSVGVVCAAVLSSNDVLSCLGILGAGSRRKTGRLGHGAGVRCNIMRLLRGKGLLLVVRPELVAGESSGVDFFTLLVRLIAMQMHRQRHCQRCWWTICWWAGSRRKTGWLGHGAGACCNIMRLLRSKGLLLAVRPEEVAGDSSDVDFVIVVVRLDSMQMPRQRHCRR